MWWLESADADGVQDDDVVSGEDVLRLGSHAVRLDDIASYKLEEVVERDCEGLLINAAVFFVAGLVFLIGVLQFGWLERFLIGFVFLFILGMSSITEVLGLNRIRYMQLTVFTQQGRRVKFTSTDSRDIDRLIGFLRQIV
ncbi:MAG: DUF6232 family protein [Filomicrobium sp.]